MQKRSDKYIVVESDGVKTLEHDVVDRHGYSDGYVFEYVNRKGDKDLVLIPRGYRFIHANGQVMVGKNEGNCSAAVLVGHGVMVGKSLDADAPGADLAVLARTHVAAMGYKGLYESKVPLKWVIVGVAVLVAVVGVVWLVRSGIAG